MVITMNTWKLALISAVMVAACQSIGGFDGVKPGLQVADGGTFASIETGCAEFRGVGVASDHTATDLTSVSGDGRFVIGHGYDLAGLAHAFRLDWRSSRRVSIDSGDGRSTFANAVSEDGHTVVGMIGPSSDEGFGFRWTEDAGLSLLGVVRDDTGSTARGVSADGNVVVGFSFTPSSSFSHATLYRAGVPKPFEIEGMVDATSVSGDGTLVLGNTRPGGDPGLLIAALWANGAIQMAQVVPGSSETLTGVRISTDGNTMIGIHCPGKGDCDGYRSRPPAIQSLAGLRVPVDVNADGSIVVGAGNYSGTGTLNSECSGGLAALWAETSGSARSIACDVLPPNLIPSGWVLDTVLGISDDGTVLAGNGTNPKGLRDGWVAVLGPDCSGS